LVPVTVAGVPPDTGPEAGESGERVGFVTKVNAAVSVTEPPAAVIETATGPPSCGLVIAVILEPVVTVNDFAVVEPNLTRVTPVKCDPVIATCDVPVTGPAFGETEETVGGGMKVKALGAVPVPPTVVTVTATAPPGWAGVVAAIVSGPVTRYEIAAVPPKVTDAVPVKLAPVIVTAVDPPADPYPGVTEVTVGRETNV
jgi:hypothetical protein